MIFNREKLQAAVQSAIVGEREAYERDCEKKDDAFHAARLDWTARYAVTWRQSLSTIVEKLDRGEPILETDAPRSRESGGAAFFGGRFGRPDSTPPSHAPFVPSRELTQLATILDATTDATISTSALKDLGFVNLRRIAPLMQPGVQA